MKRMRWLAFAVPAAGLRDLRAVDDADLTTRRRVVVFRHARLNNYFVK